MPGASPQQLLERLAGAKPVAGILLLGTEGYLREVCRKKITEAYVSEGARGWGVVRFSAAQDSLATILGQAQTMPMLAPLQVIFVSDVEAWERQEDDSRDALLQQLARYLDDPAPFTVLVLEATALDQRMRLAKVLVQKTVAVAVELSDDPSERAKLASGMAAAMAVELGVQLDSDVAEDLSEMLNGDLAAIRGELEKLAAHAGQRGRVTSADIKLLVVSTQKYSVWELTDLLASREPSRALEFLNGLLRDGEAPAALVGALAWMYRKLLEAQEIPAGVNGWQAASRLSMRPAAAEVAVRQARKFPRAQLAQGLAALYEADVRLKSGGKSQRVVMEFLVAQLAAPAPGSS